MTTLYLVRHGETKDNVAKVMQGQLHGELTSVDKAQIEKLAIAYLTYTLVLLFPVI